ncbi:MAG: hypothetical protein WCO13_10465 [Bacteroidota bacterium]
MSRQIKGVFIVFSITLFSYFVSCKSDSTEKHKLTEKFISKVENKIDTTHGDAILPPPFSEGIFPCSGCHSVLETNPVRRKLEMHDEIDQMFSHDKENRWCLDCHDNKFRDSLKLASGKRLDFKESYKLCGQCHGDKYRDWKVGVHGKRIGMWNGKKTYFLCVNCHNPHSPRFKQIKPLPPPVNQKNIK